MGSVVVFDSFEVILMLHAEGDVANLVMGNVPTVVGVEDVSNALGLGMSQYGGGGGWCLQASCGSGGKWCHQWLEEVGNNPKMMFSIFIGYILWILILW